jgi:REP-associated tyrosine transposase
VPRRPRVDEADSYHASARSNGNAPLFGNSADRHELLQQLGLVIERYEWRCQAYCLMGTHFHLILYTPRPTLSAGMARLCGRYAQWFNWRHDRSGHVFAHRFSSQHITDEEHLFAAHRYVALNPVTAGYCSRPAGWKWGSYRALAGLEPPADFLDTAGVYDLFSERPDDARHAYRALVHSGIESQGSDP